MRISRSVSLSLRNSIQVTTKQNTFFRQITLTHWSDSYGKTFHWFYILEKIQEFSTYLEYDTSDVTIFNTIPLIWDFCPPPFSPHTSCNVAIWTPSFRRSNINIILWDVRMDANKDNKAAYYKLLDAKFA